MTPRGEVSYAQLRSRVDALAMSLTDRGAGPGRVVAFPADGDPETVIASDIVQEAYLGAAPDKSKEAKK